MQVVEEELMQIRFERAVLADAAVLVAAQIAAFHHDAVLYPGIEPDGPPGYDSVEQMEQTIQRHECYKILVGQEPVGVIVVFERGEGHYHLDVIAIIPACQGQGIGSAAMRFIEESYPATRWTLDTPAYALRNQHFYEKLGYQKVGEEALADITLFAYEKRLTYLVASSSDEGGGYVEGLDHGA
jgi:ribosomal protein S18 acetylase RimI-like enzyme